MDNSYMKEYIEFSNEFRKSQRSHESISKLYDLLISLKSKDNRTKDETLILINIYSLLAYHQTAYELFETIADINNRKENSKLQVMKEKAQSLKDNFAIKDIHTLRKKQQQVKIEPVDFKPIEGKNTYTVPEKKVIVFNKLISKNNIEFDLGEHRIEDCISRITDHLNWLQDCREDLITFYNKIEYIEDKANNDWYNTLEIYRVQIFITPNDIYTEIAGGDNYLQDHLLDIEIENKEIVSMGYDG